MAATAKWRLLIDIDTFKPILWPLATLQHVVVAMLAYTQCCPAIFDGLLNKKAKNNFQNKKT